ncbi:MAG: hypothetical protein K0U38_11685 [Epsilonproteobacteria bacterium]|nr:hypothetical protein [Campylobacterota bacterium]
MIIQTPEFFIKSKVCGSTFKQKINGRHREYCNDNCKNYTKYLNALVKTIDSIDFTNHEYVKSIKSDLFSVVNHMPKKNKEVNHDCNI